MGMNVGGGRGGMKAEINVTPLVDVVLVLLIIFMVVTPMMQRGKNVTLPQATHVTGEKQGDPLILSVTPDKKTFVEAEHYADASALQARLAKELREQPSRRLLLKADEALSYGDVRKVMELAQAAGAKGVAIGVVQPKNP
ncbi:outer membrane transport energization protein ExbD [Archangium gephyra]|uniref:Biopolymer transport protein ExbD/TolR n=1 Tax=Archangium gephyra TaxID=48 RepID=A0AAC8Q6M1_9BACT|nr:biopolymer transporter ExbD [Archangium gephyra]AKJ01388.1 Biopolymer transport protein ExbD/TolR [Archangium gephyra]REG34204.1 outer membrane transport energization protein ExbD [Archangium gephyra]